MIRRRVLGIVFLAGKRRFALAINGAVKGWPMGGRETQRQACRPAPVPYHRARREQPAGPPGHAAGDRGCRATARFQLNRA